jgi:uncharacterized protein (TIGR02679 family)
MNRPHAELTGPRYAPLWAALRRRLEGNELQLSGFVALRSLDAPQQRAVQALLGSGSSRIELAAVDRALRDAVGCGLIEWLERIGPPLRDRMTERSDRARKRAEAEAVATDHRIAERPWFGEWLAVMKRDGALAAAVRLEHRRYLEAALSVLDAVLGSDHQGLPFATLVGGATGDTKRMGSATVRAMVEQALALELGEERPTSSTQRRMLWGRFGVVVDDVSSDVLVLNLRPGGDTLLARWLRDAADAGEPFRVTLRQATAMALSWHADATPTVSVCENPAVVMDASTQLRAASTPLICTEGVSSDAFWCVAEGIAGAGVGLRVHADFDAAGCSIAGAVIDRCGAHPWRFDADAYASGLARWGAHLSLPPSKGTVPDTPWDPSLAALLRSDGRALYEELVADDLVADLGADLVRDR